MTEDQQQQKLSALLRLKRFEQPPPGYFNTLVQEVHRRQRADLLRRPVWQLALERLQTFFGEHSMGRLQYGGALAAVAVTGLAIFGMSSPSKPGVGPGIAQSPSTELEPVAGPVNLRSDDMSQPRHLSLQSVQESPVSTVSVAATDVDEPVTNARLLPGPVPRPTNIVRQPRYVIDSRPASYEMTAVSFNF